MLELIKDSGFCRGVRNATDTANENAINIENGQTVYLYGDLANNSHVMNHYRAKGFIVVNDICEMKPNSTVIIRAHGVTRAVLDALAAKNMNIQDCTCVKVKRIHNIVERAVGSKIVIIGQKNHPEVVGTRGWCQNNDAIIMETEADLGSLNANDDICVVGQTTCKLAWWNQATAMIRARFPNAIIHNTLCNVVMLRSKSSQELASRMDTMVVIGDVKSANSRELYGICAQVCVNTLFVSSVEELQEIDANAKIGIVGSASTPAEVIDKVYEYLAFLQFLAGAKYEIENFTQTPMHQALKHRTANDVVLQSLQDLEEQGQNGKRIRGAMIRLGEQIVSGRQAYSLQVAVAYELFQTAILIHDDIIDRSHTRRGKTTIHAKNHDLPDAKHFALSQAICAGLLGQFYTNNILAAAEMPDAIKMRLLRVFSLIQLNTIEGEIMDVTLPHKPVDPALHFEEYQDIVNSIYTLKTAIYTLAGPLELGAICGGANEELAHAIRDIALPLGIAFQIKDDLLGMYASDKILGKPAISDLQERKQTSIFGYAYKHASKAQRKILDRLYGKKGATHADLETVRDIFTATGAAQFAENEICKLSQQSLDLIAKLPIADESKTLLRGLVHYLTIRKY